MALSSSNLAAEPRSFSLGPVKTQLKTIQVLNGDTSGTISFDALSEVQMIIVTGIEQTAQPTYSGNVATLAFADPLATRHGQVLAIGR